MSSKRSLFVRLVPCRCLRGEEETVTQLDYSHCSLEQVPKEIFGFEKTLEELYLDANQIEELPKQLFNCQLLHRLSLPDNDLTVLPPAIANLINLRELDVSKNSIQEFPENIKNCKVLTIVEASVNPISKLPEGFTQLLSLTQLYLNDAFLEFLPASFGRSDIIYTLSYFSYRIKELWMDGNKLTMVPGMVGMLKQLTYLDVSKNNVELVDEQINGCENLQDLLLSNNALTQLPGSIGTTHTHSHTHIKHAPHFQTITMGCWKNATVLFLHSNKLESLPKEMGDMQKLKVVNLSDNKLKNLPYSFTKLNQMTAMWLSENQVSSSFSLRTCCDASLFKMYEQRKQRAQVAFECDEDKDERETPPREGNLKRYPTPYPDELKNMVKTAQSVAHRLKEDESGDELAGERNHIGVQSVGVKVSSGGTPCANGKALELESKTTVNSIQNSTPPEPRDVPDNQDPERVPLKTSDGPRAMVNHEDTLEDSEELSSEEEEMKIAEMRPPLIEISINQPKVVALSKDKKDDNKDADSLLDETVANSNQNNSNCSSPSRMSDSVSLTTDSSQDNSLCTPEREAKIQEDENLNQLKETVPLLQNCNGSETSLQTVLKTQRSFESKAGRMAEYDLSMEERLAVIEKGINNGMADQYSKWDQINMNVSKFPPDNRVVYDDLEKTKSSLGEPGLSSSSSSNNNNTSAQSLENLENGNQNGKMQQAGELHFNGRIEETPVRYEVVRTASAGVTASSDMSLSRSTEELSPEKRRPPPVMKAQSISNMEAGGMKLYSIEGESPPYEAVAAAAAARASGAQGQSIVRSKSASLLNDQQLQVYPGSSASSSDLLSSSKPPTSMARYPAGPPPQYNVQYTSSTVPKDNLWGQRTPVPPDQAYLPPQHSLANTNYSNRNNAPPYPHQPQPTRGPAKAPDMWAKERVLPPGSQRGTLQRQSSTSSNASMVMQDPRRMPGPESDYLTYRDIHTMGRGHPHMSLQRPLSARTYSMDEPGAPRPQSARPPAHEVPERTMSVSDFNYQQHGSPTKRPNMRVKSEHSLLDGPPGGGGRVPADWRDQVIRHIEAKKMEKMTALSRSLATLYGSQGSLAFSTLDGRQFGAHGPSVPLMNGQMCPPPVRPQMSCSQNQMARHPSREQLIDYLMHKVSQQPPGAPRHPHESLPQEMHVKIEKNPELGFSISGGVGGRGNPFHPEDNGIFVTRVQPEGPASKLLQPGDKIIQANGYNFVNIDHGNAVSLLKNFPSTVDLIIIRDMAA
uniref:Erbb2 interacting protein n=1 Tax=Astyanax mexicanus TaxID=7994 RepID=A0A8B9J9K8_ASTMX